MKKCFFFKIHLSYISSSFFLSPFGIIFRLVGKGASADSNAVARSSTPREHTYMQRRVTIETSTIRYTSKVHSEGEDPHHVNQYRLHGVLGKGAFGTVFKAENTERPAFRAIKCLSKGRYEKQRKRASCLTPPGKGKGKGKGWAVAVAARKERRQEGGIKVRVRFGSVIINKTIMRCRDPTDTCFPARSLSLGLAKSWLAALLPLLALLREGMRPPI